VTLDHSKSKGSIRRSEHESGMRLVTEHMPGIRSVTLGVWVTIGSRDEADRVSGASHFLEHVLFKGTKTRSALDIAEAFDAVGGDLNAFTAKEHTAFYARVLDGDLPMAVDHLADMLQDSVIRASDLDGERKVILEEINMHEDAPDELVHDLFMQTLWPGDPLGRAVLGTVETVSSISREQVRRFWKQHYIPGNFVVAAAGNVDHDALGEMLAERMVHRPDVPARGPMIRRPTDPPEPSGRTEVRHRATEQAHICLGTGGLPRMDPRRYAFSIVTDAVGGGMSSRLFQEIREKRGLVYSVYAYHSMFAKTGAFVVYAGTTPSKAREVMTIARDQLEDIAENGVSEEELARSKSHIKGSMVLSLEETSSRMTRLGKSEIAHGEVITLDEVLEKLDAVTLEECREVAADVLSRPRTVAVIGPFDEDAFEEFGGAPFRERVVAEPAGAMPAGRRAQRRSG
jgi:predicted Zn-dependent peptidase